MFRAEPLVKIRLVLLASEVPDAALELARFGVYSPGQYAPEALTDNTAAAYRDAWQEAESRLSKLVERCGGMPDLVIPEGGAAPTLRDLEELNTWHKDVWNACQAAFEGEARVQEEVRHLDALEETLGRLERLNVDLAYLLRADRSAISSGRSGFGLGFCGSSRSALRLGCSRAPVHGIEGVRPDWH